MDITFVQAEPSEDAVLTSISFAAKRYWNYPDEYFDIWEKELTITGEYIAHNIVFNARVGHEVVGYFSICKVEADFWSGRVFVNKGHWLEHIFIKPSFIGQGIGRELIQFAKETCRKLDIHKLYIFSDPHAKGFYDKIGAHYIRESESSIAGRTVSLFELDM